MNPIENVVIRAEGGVFYIPTMQQSILGSPGRMFGPLPQPEGAIGETDADGRARMLISGQRPVKMRFFKQGYSDGRLIVESGQDIVTGALAWTEGQVEFRLYGTDQEVIRKRMIFRVRVEDAGIARNRNGSNPY
jgi:hypothetical protein